MYSEFSENVNITNIPIKMNILLICADIIET